MTVAMAVITLRVPFGKNFRNTKVEKLL